MREFEVSIEEREVSDLVRRIEMTRWPRAVDVGWAEGTDPDYLRELLNHWSNGFDWRARERHLNRHDQVLVTVGDVELHATHQRGTGPRPMPIVLTHGWPSTFAEWTHVIDALTDPGSHGGDPADAFHVVAPSLPGYGFSSAGTSPGTTPRAIASMWVQVMAELGYDRFAAHGCDWGAYVTALLALDHPDRVLGAHMGMVSLGGPGGIERSQAEDDYVDRVRRWRQREHGYVAIQSTKPATLAYGLNDSPAGLAAWIAEKWRAWSDCGGDPETAIDRDDLLTAISLYWFTGTIGTASRLYLESARDPVRLADGQRVEVPCGFLLETAGSENAAFLDVPRTGAPPRTRAERAFDIHRWTEVPEGGHFPALEIPDVFVREIRDFYRPLR